MAMDNDDSLSPFLPPEIILDIFSQLNPNSRDERHTLTQCALVAGTFRQDVQKRLFRVITISYIIDTGREDGQEGVLEVGSDRTHKIMLALSGSPILATFVRRLDIHLCFKFLSSFTYNASNTPQISPLPTILSYMRNLEGCGWHCSHSSNLLYNELTPMLRSAIAAVLLRNNLRDIDLRGINHIPPALLCSSSNLRTLAITDLLERMAPGDSAQPPRSIMITTLTTHSFRPALKTFVKFLQTPKCPITLSKLESLSVKAPAPEHKSLCAILHMCRNTLTHLHCNFPRVRLNSSFNPLLGSPAVDLSDMLNLSELHLTGKIESKWSDRGREFANPHNTFIPIEWIAGTLQTLSSISAPSLDLFISIYLSNVSLKVVSATRWGILVDALQLSDRIYKELRVTLFIDDSSIPTVLYTFEPDLALKRFNMLKENLDLQKLGDALKFVHV